MSKSTTRIADTRIAIKRREQFKAAEAEASHLIAKSELARGSKMTPFERFEIFRDCLTKNFG